MTSRTPLNQALDAILRRLRDPLGAGRIRIVPELDPEDLPGLDRSRRAV